MAAEVLEARMARLEQACERVNKRQDAIEAETRELRRPLDALRRNLTSQFRWVAGLLGASHHPGRAGPVPAQVARAGSLRAPSTPPANAEDGTSAQGASTARKCGAGTTATRLPSSHSSSSRETTIPPPSLDKSLRPSVPTFDRYLTSTSASSLSSR